MNRQGLIILVNRFELPPGDGPAAVRGMGEQTNLVVFFPVAFGRINTDAAAIGLFKIAVRDAIGSQNRFSRPPNRDLLVRPFINEETFAKPDKIATDGTILI